MLTKYCREHFHEVERMSQCISIEYYRISFNYRRTFGNDFLSLPRKLLIFIFCTFSFRVITFMFLHIRILTFIKIN